MGVKQRTRPKDKTYILIARTKRHLSLLSTSWYSVNASRGVTQQRVAVPVAVTVAKRMAAVVARGAREASVERAQWQRRTTRLDPKTRPCLPRTALPSPTRSCHAQAAGQTGRQALGRHA